MKGKYLIFLNFTYLVFIFIWHSLQVSVFDGFDGKGRLSIISSFIILLVNIISSKSYLKSFYSRKSILKIWLFWFIYASINTFFQYNGKDTPVTSFIGQVLFVPFVVMSIIANLPSIEIKRILQYMQHIIYCSFLLLFLFARKIDGRFSVELFDPNELSLLVSLLVIIISIRYIRKEINLFYLILLLILPTYYTIFSGSRMAFGSFLILIMGLIFSFKERLGVIKIIKYLFIISIFSLLVFIVLENTIVGERLLNTAEQSSEALIDNPAEGTIFEYYGDRGVYYILGWQIFLANPIFGIGLRNFIEYWSQVSHVEYMIQLSELGIIGFIIYVMFNSMILKNLIKKRKCVTNNLKPLYTYLLFAFSSILFSASVLFLYPSIAIAALYGLLILLAKKQDIKILKICTE